jgi:phage terminase large subunit
MEFEPRDAFRPFHERSARWTCIVAHRRAGKTLASVADLVTRALATGKSAARYAYIAPFYTQAKAIAWDYLKRLSQDVAERVSESELSVELANGSRIRLYGADNPDALRGIYLDGVILDEYGDMRPNVWGEIIRPLLTDRMGWAAFIGTPKGRNHFTAIYDTARAESGWLCLTLKASETNLILPGELDDARRQMTPEQFAQEFECEFNVPALGAIYRVELSAARKDERIGMVGYDMRLPVATAWDLGVGDSTAIWFAQQAGTEVRLIDYYEASGEGLQHYAKVLGAKPYTYGRHIAPHDIEVRELGTGKSRLEIARELGIRFEVLKASRLEDGINATRMAFNRLWFDEKHCARGLDCLSNYLRDYNDKLGEFKATPVHDWASHGADALRYLILGLRENKRTAPIKYPSLGIY